MQQADRVKDPRWQESRMLFDTYLAPSWKDKLPADPHASENIRYAMGMLSIGEDGAEQILETCLVHYIGTKYHDALRDDINRLVRSAARKGQNDATSK